MPMIYMESYGLEGKETIWIHINQPQKVGDQYVITCQLLDETHLQYEEYTFLGIFQCVFVLGHFFGHSRLLDL